MGILDRSMSSNISLLGKMSWNGEMRIFSLSSSPQPAASQFAWLSMAESGYDSCWWGRRWDWLYCLGACSGVNRQDDMGRCGCCWY
jgi:hypothetical protein